MGHTFRAVVEEATMELTTISTVVTADDQKSVSATLVLPASPEEVFETLASDAVTRWWVRPGVFDTREWSGDVREGGPWQASGMGAAGPYGLEGEFVRVDRPRELSHTWHLVGTPSAPSIVSYVLEPIPDGTRVTFRHGDFGSPEATEANRAGWQTSFEALANLLER